MEGMLCKEVSSQALGVFKLKVFKTWGCPAPAQRKETHILQQSREGHLEISNRWYRDVRKRIPEGSGPSPLQDAVMMRVTMSWWQWWEWWRWRKRGREELSTLQIIIVVSKISLPNLDSQASLKLISQPTKTNLVHCTWLLRGIHTVLLQSNCFVAKSFIFTLVCVGPYDCALFIGGALCSYW